MKPLQMTFRHIDPIAEVEHLIRAKADALYADLPDARQCEVTIDRQHKLPWPGARCSVRVGLSVPGVYLVAEADARDSSAVAINTALGQAFDTVRQRGLARRQRLSQPPRRGRRSLQLLPDVA